MTVPMQDPYLYGAKYDVRRKCNKCNGTEWLDMEKGFVHCNDKITRIRYMV